MIALGLLVVFLLACLSVWVGAGAAMIANERDRRRYDRDSKGR